MKLRIKGNSIRLRLTKTEVETLSKEGSFQETCAIGPLNLNYALKTKDGCNLLDAGFEDQILTVYMNPTLAAAWHDNSEVGYRNITTNAQGDELFILVEKDFVCLDETFEDQSDNYPNPNASC